MPWFIDGAGKIERRPSLDRYDNMKPRVDDVSALDLVVDYGNSLFFGRVPPSIKGRAELEAFGVDGSVPLARARVNAGLDKPVTMVLFGALPFHVANDNQKIAVAA